MNGGEPTDVPSGPSTPRPGRHAVTVWRARWRTRHLAAAAAATIVVAVLAIVLVASLFRPGADRREPLTRIEAVGPDVVAAGEPWSIELSESVEQATVTLSGPWGTESFTVAGPTDRIRVPEESTTRSGSLLAVVRDGTSIATAVVDIDPGRAVDGTPPLAGPRSMIADRQHWVMVTALPRDRFGNVVEDGTLVEVLARHPDGSLEVLAAEVRDLYAAVRVFSETVAGRTGLRLETQGTTGPEVEVLEVPGPPAEVLFEPVVGPLRADGRQLVTLRTTRLTDRFDNELLDGTAGVATISSPTGRSTQRGVTVDGRIEIVVEAPSAPGPLTVELDVDGVRSSPLTLEFAADVTELPVVAEFDDGVLRVEIGSVLTRLGGFVPDGTPAAVVAGDVTHELVLEGGIGAIEIETDRVDAVTVEVLGVSVRVVVQ